MEKSRENWPLHMEMGHDKDLFQQCQSGHDDEFLKDILQQPALSAESESQSFAHNNNFTASVAGATATTDGSSLSSDDMVCSYFHGKRPRPSSAPRTYILSFDNSTIIPATPEPVLGYQSMGGEGTRSSKSHSLLSSKKRALENSNSEPKPRDNQGGKKNRNDSQIMDHILAERKRRQDLTEKFIALSATIPGLKKMDKSSILREAISYVKQLQERVTELEQRIKRSKESMVILKKSNLCANEDTTSSETNSDENCYRPSGLLPDVEARVLENEVLIEIHCEKENGIQLKILELLENLHLYVTGSTVLPFGNSTLGITIIAQMSDAHRMTVDDLVKNLKQVLLNHRHSY